MSRATDGFGSDPKRVGGIDSGKVEREEIEVDLVYLRMSRKKASDSPRLGERNGWGGGDECDSTMVVEKQRSKAKKRC